MKVYGLIGNPLGHSFSKKYFTEKFKQENISDCEYRNFEIKNLSLEIKTIKENRDLSGLNITIPYKSEIIQFLDIISEECKQINACNCIKVQDEKWQGYNTDIQGFTNSFVSLVQPHHKKALILGTGGSSKAVAYCLQKLNIEFLFVSRKEISSEKIISYNSLSKQIINEFQIIINTTPLGMFPNDHEYPKISYEFITPHHYCFDLIYNPSKTVFLQKAEARGAIIKNGADMLIIQAEESWKIWNV